MPAPVDWQSPYEPLVCGVTVLDAAGTLVDANTAAQEMLGIRFAAFNSPLDRAVVSVERDDGTPLLPEQYPSRTALRTGQPQRDIIMRITRHDGGRCWLQVDAIPIRDADGAVARVVTSFVDVTARKQAEDSFRTLFADNPQPAWVYDRETLRFLEANAAAVAHYGYSRAEFLALRIVDIRPPEDVPRVLEDVRREEPVRLPQAWRHCLKDGRMIDVEITSRRVSFAGRAASLIMVQDITQRRQAEEALRHQVLHDALTGLPNRALFADRLGVVLQGVEDEGAGAETGAETGAALLLLDLDRFKRVNDTLGHHAGDLLLQEVARRLQLAVRGGDTVARLAGDEFVILLPGSGAEEASAMARRLLAALTAPIVLDGAEVVVGASIGVALAPMQGRDEKALLRAADAAMYAAKRAGGSHAVSPG